MATPYSVSAQNYLEAGWSPIPLPHKEKWPPPDGFTGAAGKYVDAAQLQRWLGTRARVNSGKLNYPPGNVALRLPRGVLGIDVDAYGSKAGEQTLAKAEEAWGTLPPTWVTTSRTDGVSGIRLFRIPEDLAWPGELTTGKGVELIRWDHRFAIVSPSIHDKTGNEYKWFTQDGVTMTEYPDAIPLVEDLAWLPELWVEGLTSGRKWTEREVNEDMGATEVRDWLAARLDPETLCSTTRSTLTKWINSIRHAGDDGGAHEAALQGAWALIGDAGAGHSGIHKSLNKLRKAFIVAVKDRRGADGERLAKEEWARIVVRGVQKVSAEGEPEAEDPCESISAPKAKARTGSDAIVWRLDEVGNAERFIRVADGRARYVEAYKGWMVWEGNRWVLDDNKQIDRWMVKALNTIESDAEFLKGEDDAIAKAFKAHFKSSSTAGKVRGSLELAKGRKGIMMPPESFDSNPTLVNCKDNAIELRKKGIKARPAWQDDYNTLSTGVDYNPKAKGPLWEDFLNRFQPDPEVQEWIQKLVGYSLLGTNPKRLMVVCWGPTSTGKTTFAEAIRNALGDYAKDIHLSIFRDNQDERARPDLVEALPKRIVFAEEVSSAWHMHPDQIKRITGGSQISARVPHSPVYIHRIPAFTPWLLMNGVPTIDGADTALYRRLIVVPWTTQISQSEEDSDVKAEMIETEREAILAWALRGYEMWRESADDLVDPPTSAISTALDFRSQLSDVDRFLAEACDGGAEYAELPRRLYEAYVMWCDWNGVKERDRVSNTKFGIELSGKGYGKKQIKIEGQPTWHRIGLRLKLAFDSVMG